MAEQEPKVEMKIGNDEVRLQGSEDFISNELETIITNIDFSPSNGVEAPQEGDESSPEQSETPEETGNSGNSGDRNGEEEHPTPITEVANNLDVRSDLLANHFYIENDNIHIQDQYEIPQKYALIGYCMLSTEMTGETIFDNKDTREKLVEQERLPVDDWGGTLLYNLREDNLIKNDPDSDKSRNIPFKITPKAEKEFRDWILTDEDT